MFPPNSMFVLVCPMVWWHTAAIWEDLDDWKDVELEDADRCRVCIDDGSWETKRGCNISNGDSEMWTE